MNQSTTLAILGYGEAAQTISAGLSGQGPAEVRAWKRPPWHDLLPSLAEEAGVVLCAEVQDAIQPADIVFSLVPPTAAVEVAQAAAPFLAGKVFLDLNAASHDAMMAVHKIVTDADGQFVDGAIMGPLARQKHQVSTVVSGVQAAILAERLGEWDMAVKAIGTQPAMASTVKMIRSVYTKGLEGIVLEFMTAAHRFGATEEVLDSLEEILELGPFLRPFREMVDALVAEQVDHAPRRAAEMEQVVETIRQLGLEPRMSQGTFSTLSSVAKEAGLQEKFAQQDRYTPHDVIEVIAECTC